MRNLSWQGSDGSDRQEHLRSLGGDVTFRIKCLLLEVKGFISSLVEEVLHE